MEVAIIVAGGSGRRMQNAVPKQFLELKGLPVLMHTLQAFHNYSGTIRIILVLPENNFSLWEELVQKYNFKIPHKVCPGGSTRTQSVRNGLKFVEDEDLVAIHDGVRPFVSKEVLVRAYQGAEAHGNAISAVDLKDSIRLVDESGRSKAVNRSKYRIIQTPQVFKGTLIKKAYSSLTVIESFTDDASLVEKLGFDIHLVEGDYSNLKITTQEDLILADSYLQRQ